MDKLDHHYDDLKADPIPTLTQSKFTGFWIAINFETDLCLIPLLNSDYSLERHG